MQPVANFSAANNDLLRTLLSEAHNGQIRQPVQALRVPNDSQMTAVASLPVAALNPDLYIDDIDLTGLSKGQREAVLSILQGKNILLTGPAGTGKSHTIKKITEIFEQKKYVIGICSTTGASAILIEGKTIHSWSGIGICGTKESALKRVMTYTKPQSRIRGTHVLIIDEVSMLSGPMLDILDYVFRIVRNSNLPFGGIQMVLCGDFFQLSPVKCSKFAFEAECWNTGIQEVHELTDIYRQDNRDFCIALNEIRIGEVSQKTVDLISACVGREFKGDIKPTELYPVNEDVSALNEAELWKLASETNPIRAIDAFDDFPEKPKPRVPRDAKFFQECKERLNRDCIAPEVLELAVGAQVMLLKNLNVEAGLANGSRGVVIGFSNGGAPIVRFLNDQEMVMQTAMWRMRINDTVRAVRTQYPLRAAYALSMHKSQGMSLDLVRMDLGSKIFAEGQFYTAISRVRSLEGLSIINLNWQRIFVSKQVKNFYGQYRHRITK